MFLTYVPLPVGLRRNGSGCRVRTYLSGFKAPPPHQEVTPIELGCPPWIRTKLSDVRGRRPHREDDRAKWCSWTRIELSLAHYKRAVLPLNDMSTLGWPEGNDPSPFRSQQNVQTTTPRPHLEHRRRIERRMTSFAAKRLCRLARGAIWQEREELNPRRSGWSRSCCRNMSLPKLGSHSR